MAIDWGLTWSIAGTVISAAGFAFTLQQLSRTAKATEAVNSAVGNLRNRMASFDYANECVRAGRSLQHASTLLRLKQWGDAAAVLLDAQVILYRISNNGEGKESIRAACGEVSESLLQAIERLEEADEKKIDFSSSELIMTIRKQSNLLDSETVSINRDLYKNA